MVDVGRMVGNEVVLEMPPMFLELCARVVAEGIFPPDQAPNCIIVRKYPPGSGIAAHTDDPKYGAVVASLSLGSATQMDFSLGGVVVASQRLEPRSLCVLSGPARTD